MELKLWRVGGEGCGVKDMKRALALEYGRQKRKSWTPEGCKEAGPVVFLKLKKAPH